MRIVVLIWFWFCIASIAASLVFIVSDNYPRKREARTRGDDVALMFANIAVANVLAWVLWL